jgi:hypothetical protein
MATSASDTAEPKKTPRWQRGQEDALGSQFEFFRDQIEHEEQEEKLTRAQANYWTDVWEVSAWAAWHKTRQNRNRFYWLHGTSMASAVIVPALVGLSLSGTVGEIFRWIAFVVGLVGALTAGAAQLFRFGSRWKLNHDYYRDLLAAGRTYVLSERDITAWESFREKVDRLTADYAEAYEIEVIVQVQPKPTPSPEPGDPKPGSPGQPKPMPPSPDANGTS